MTDFILQFEKPVGYYEDHGDFLDKQVEFMGLTMSYTKFLRQPLTPEMFVPIDKIGDPFIFNEEGEEYEKAQEKILFKGFKINFDGKSILCLNLEEVANIDFDKTTKNCLPYKTVEDLVVHELPLTPSALKQIYG